MVAVALRQPPKPLPEIDFIIAGGAEIGLGHIMRSAALAAAAARRGWSVRAFVDGDRSATDCWRLASGQQDVLGWPDWNPRSPARVTVFDHPGEKSRWLSKARQAGTATVVLDDSRYPRQAELTICPALHHQPLEETKATKLHLLQGPHYAILAAVHLEMPHRALTTRTKLLLSLGGADPHQVTPRIAPILRSALVDCQVRHGIESCHAVLGPAFGDSGDRIAEILVRSGWRVHRALDPMRMAKLMSETRLAVIGFGTSLIELAWHGTPHLSVTHHPADETFARSLEAQGIGTHLGYAETLDDPIIATRFRRALEDASWQRESSRKAFRALDGGQGVERILDRLELLAQTYFVRSSSTRNSVSTTWS